MQNKKIASFTGLRFIMIMVIVISHFEFLAELPNFRDFYSTYLHNATFAVDFFFLLSGFGMMYWSPPILTAESSTRKTNFKFMRNRQKLSLK